MADPMKIVVDVVNSEKVKELTAEIKKQEQEIAKWNREMQAGIITQQQFESRATGAAKAIQTANAQLKEIPQTASAAGRGLGQLSYALDDLQYGFGAIVNNIPQIALAMGAGAGLAGAVGIAAVAINQLVKHWGELTDMMQAAWAGSSLDQLTKLREKAEAATAAFEKLEKTRPKSEQKAGSGMSDVITEGPTEKILKGTAEAIAQDPMLGKKPESTTPSDLATKLFALIGAIPASELGMVEKKGLTKQRQKEADEENMKRAKELIGAASTGDPQAMLTLESLAQRHKGSFPPEFIQDIKDQTPEGQKRIEQKRLEAQGDRNARKMADEEKDRLQKEKEDQNRLEIQGRANAKKSDKDTVIKSLEDERKKIQQAQQDFDERMWQRQQGGQAQIMQGGGAKNLSDMYLKGGMGNSTQELAKQAHEQRNKTNKLLQAIDDKLKEERKVIIKN